ncbi:MAG TPA: Holliday junction resolvase RuvX, partial [Candidatus Hydrogenedentes bacterium]|nr:Holliday junction resolvase RuvX [Candidatus Hydrogenedentota bacterium]
GLPLEASGDEGPQAAKVREFMEAFTREIPLPVVLQDERLTTVSAERMLISANMRRENRRGVVDKVAAAHILQAWLDRAASRRGAAE